MPHVEVAERPGRDHSEDRVVVLPNSVALLDGATSLEPGARTGGWYAERLAAELAELLPREELGLRDILRAGIASTASRHGLVPGDSPSSTAALLRWTSTAVEALVLADSPVVVFTGTGYHPVTDDRLARLRSPGRRGGFRDRLRSGSGYDEEHWTRLRAAMRGTARSRNVDGGFWVAEADPDAADRAVVARWPRDEVRAALLASDGVSCGVDDYGLYRDWPELLAEATTDGPRAVLDRVRAAEEGDPDGRRWPRAKRHDDQSLVVLRFG
ncbi:hypothetical protein C1701_12500 [Actinoalloteichus sp. AHMU CJ021]|uniref:protein phosphatase 2C domain-containing protein n=1 Tax=Actinoalloteichus TaxID=65496 RepID=UPI0004A9F765|nr:protein phosphatase 2C domain-containing protein [Actinoalloteichus caeruleus]AUS79039.1 hypothetical protein C1701_12500 [Actinoalloteichus sp. AHMU CJ021]